VQSELDKLVELQKTDTNIRRLKSTIESAEQRRASIEQEFEQHASSIREIQGRRDAAQTGRADLEKQIAENKIYIERADRNLIFEFHINLFFIIFVSLRIEINTSSPHIVENWNSALREFLVTSRTSN
jgi:hypothetical protein